MAIKDPHHHDLFDPDKSGGGGSFSEFVGGQAGISPCHRSRHQRDDRQRQAAAVLLIVELFPRNGRNIIYRVQRELSVRSLI